MTCFFHSKTNSVHPARFQCCRETSCVLERCRGPAHWARLLINTSNEETHTYPHDSHFGYHGSSSSSSAFSSSPTVIFRQIRSDLKNKNCYIIVLTFIAGLLWFHTRFCSLPNTLSDGKFVCFSVENKGKVTR